MKAIEILKEFEDIITSSVEDGKYGNATFCFNYRFLEAIEELENLQNENKSLVKTLEKTNEEMIELRKENEDLKSRSCVDCKYGCANNFEDDMECEKLGADTQGLYFKKDFYCKNWESR